MKKMKLFAGLLLAFCLVFGMSVTAFAYDYTVTISTGNVGKISGSTSITIPCSYDPASPTSLDLSSTGPYVAQITPDDSRYYVKGFHISGHNEGDLLGIETIDKDQVFVATYGIVGKRVSYEVRYQTAAGATLYEKQTFYGNVGDTPVVAYRYVENYVPRDLTISQKLVDDETKNVFTFVYDPAPTSEVIVIDEGGAGGGGAPAAPAAPGAAVVPGGNQPAGGGGEEIEPEPTPLGPGERETETIEPETAPLGPGGESQPEPGPGPEPGKPGSALPWAIGGGAAVVIAAAIGIIVGVKKKKK